MMWKTHLVVSLFLSQLLFQLFSINRGIFLLVFLFGSLVPDIDSARSFLGSRVKVVGWLSTHRGIFHSLAMLILLTLLVWSILPQFALVFGLGYSVHLILDALTREGIAPFFPLKYRLRGWIRTNSVAEHILFVVCMISGFYLLLR